MDETIVILMGEARRELSSDGRATLIVITGSSTGPINGIFAVGGAQDDDRAADGNLDVVAKRPLTSLQRSSEHLGHAKVALQLVYFFRVDGVHLDIVTSPAIVERVTPDSPSEGKTFSM